MLGNKGAQFTSKTLWSDLLGRRLDVENPNPGKRPGQVHLHDGSRKYLYDLREARFINASSAVNDLLNQTEIKQAIIKAMKLLGEEYDGAC